MRSILGPGYKPLSPIWKQYAGKLEWNDGQSKRYAIPWTVVTPANADSLLQGRK
jgi:putative xylitol transport system substrate-binding protein